MATARETAIAAERQDIVTRLWLSTPALIIIFCAALGPLLVVLFYTFLTKGDYGGVKWIFSTEGWFSVFFERDIFDDTVTLADAHLSIFWRSVKLSLATTVLALLFGFPTAYFIATRSERTRDIWLFLVTIPLRITSIMAKVRMRRLVQNGMVTRNSQISRVRSDRVAMK